MRNVAAAVGQKYPAEIATRLWVAAADLASHLDWAEVDAALSDATRLSPEVPPNQSRRFAILCRLLDLALRFGCASRAIRLLKPHLRGQ